MHVLVRTDNLDIDEKQLERIERVARLGLTRFEPALRRVELSLCRASTQVHGECFRVGVSLELQRRREVSVVEIERDMEPAVDRAVARAARVAQRRLLEPGARPARAEAAAMNVRNPRRG